MTDLNLNLRVNQLERDVKELREWHLKLVEDIADLMEMMKREGLYDNVRKIK